MFDFFKNLFDTDGFPPRRDCGEAWTEGHAWLHILSDIAIFGAYLAIPVALVYFLVRKRSEMVFHRIFLLFGAFILACGTGHLIEATIFWHPWYRLSGLIKLVTAIVSWATVIALLRVAPEAIKLPGLAALNDRLKISLAQQKLAHAELTRTNQDLDQFAYVASHDLRAPLRAIDSLTEWIEEDAARQLPETSKRHFDQLKNRVRRMETLLEDLLQYSRAGRHETEPEQVEPASLVREILQLSPPPPGFEVEIVEPMPSLKTQRVALEQCLRNLIANAFKHHDKSTGEVEVRAQADGGNVIFEVEDDGPGIPPEFHDRVFTPFQTLRPRDEVEGSGIGLSIVARLCERLGGKVELESELGEGATFRLTIPNLNSPRTEASD